MLQATNPLHAAPRWPVRPRRFALAVRGTLAALATVAALSTLTTLVALPGCATAPAPPNPAMQGRWRLDSAASDDATARITSAVRAAQKRFLHRHPGEGPGGAGQGGADSSDTGSGGNSGGGDAGGGGDEQDLGELGVGGGPIAPDYHELRDRLQQALASPHLMSFHVQGDDVQIQRDDLPPRDYQAGETLTEFNEYGTAQLKTAWKDGAFVVSQRYTSGARLEERYALDGQGALVYTRMLRDPEVGRIQLRSVYRRPGP